MPKPLRGKGGGAGQAPDEDRRADNLLPLVYDELRTFAAARESPDPTRRKDGPERGGDFTRHDLDPPVLFQPFRLTRALIQIGAKGDVQPFETG